MRKDARLRISMLKNIQYITDAADEIIAVILPLDKYRELLECMQVIPMNEVDDAPRRPANEIISELVAKGEMD